MLDLRFSESELEARHEHIVSFIEGIVADAPVEGAVLGLSGGVDSSLVAHLAVEALGSGGLHGLVMPGEPSSDENMSDAELVAERLGIEYDVVPIDEMVERVVSGYPSARAEPNAVANTRPRIRAVLNHLVANYENRLVLGTGNRSEQQTGKFSRWGDAAVACHPVGNLYKQQVRQLARHVGVAEDIVTKTPTAEIMAGRTDEDELGLDYDTLDAILALHIDGPLSKRATVEVLGVEEATVEHVEHLNEKSAYKRRMPPSPELVKNVPRTKKDDC